MNLEQHLAKKADLARCIKTMENYNASPEDIEKVKKIHALAMVRWTKKAREDRIDAVVRKVWPSRAHRVEAEYAINNARQYPLWIMAALNSLIRAYREQAA